MRPVLEALGLVEKADAKKKNIAQSVDVDNLGKNFNRFAGLDDDMTREEFEEFTKSENMTRATSAALWVMLDKDMSGTVSRDEFRDALLEMQHSKAWLRYCPTCSFDNDCAFCQECNASCNKCTERAYCAACWAQHPGRNVRQHEVLDDEGNKKHVHAFGSREYWRAQLVLRPLEWAYNSNVGLSVAQKARVRVLLQEQYKAQDEAIGVGVPGVGPESPGQART